MRSFVIPSIILPLVALTAPVSAQAIPETDAYLQQRATGLNDRIDIAVKERKLTKAKGSRLHLTVGRVQTQAGNLQARNGSVASRDVDRLNQQLTDVERQLPVQQ